MLSEISSFVNYIRRRNPESKTYRNYRCDLKQFVACVGDVDPESVTVHDIDTFIVHQANKGLQTATINRQLNTVKAFYSYLADEDSSLTCPVLPHRHHLVKPQRLPRPAAQPDLDRLFSVITDLRDRAIFLLMLRSGLRISEVARLKLCDLYLDEDYPRLLIYGKYSRERAAYLSPQTERALRAYLAERPHVPCDFVFLSYQAQGLSTTAIHKRLMVYRALAGISITAHQLRHSFANDLVSAGVHVTTIQKLLGHAWLETTQNYVQANDLQVKADFYAATQTLGNW